MIADRTGLRPRPDFFQAEETMRYYFHLVGETSIHIDHIGEEFSDLQDVEARAHAMAREEAVAGKGDGWSVSVVDAHNMEVFRLPFAEAQPSNVAVLHRKTSRA